MAEVQKKVETRGRPRLSEDTRLTGKQLKFVELVATREGQDTLRNLAVEAGFSVRGAHTIDQMSKAEVKKALDELKRQLGEKVIDVEPDRVELLEADQDGAIQH